MQETMLKSEETWNKKSMLRVLPLTSNYNILHRDFTSRLRNDLSAEGVRSEDCFLASLGA